MACYIIATNHYFLILRPQAGRALPFSLQLEKGSKKSRRCTYFD